MRQLGNREMGARLRELSIFIATLRLLRSNDLAVESGLLLPAYTEPSQMKGAG